MITRILIFVQSSPIQVGEERNSNHIMPREEVGVGGALHAEGPWFRAGNGPLLEAHKRHCQAGLAEESQLAMHGRAHTNTSEEKHVEC